MTPNQKILKTFILFFFFCISLFLICLPFIAPFILDADAIKQALFKALSKKTNLTITTGKMDLTYFPRIVVTLEDIVLTPAGSGTIQINRALIYPDLSDLMSGKVSLGEIRLNGVEASMTLKNCQTQKTAPIPQALLTKPEELLAFFHGEHKDFTLSATNIHTDLFARADVSFLISPEKREITGKVTIESIFIDKPWEIGLPLPKTIQSCDLDLLKLNLSYKTAESNKTAGDFSCGIEAKGLTATIEGHKNSIISGSTLKATVQSKDQIIKAALKPSVFDSPGLKVSIDFLYDPVSNKVSLTFFGNTVDIDTTRATSLALFRGNSINTHLFDIIRAGEAPGVRVAFFGTTIDNLFDPKTMIITGNLENGSVKIPQTGLIVTKILGSARVKNGILHTDVTTGRLAGSLLEKGNLDINLLSPKNPFEGEFLLNANLAPLPGILIELLPDTLLAQEMTSVTQVTGTAKGTLYLNHRENNLAVRVDAHNIKISGRYLRIPGRVSIENGDFHYDDDRVRIAHVDGWIDNHRFSNITACLGWEDKFFELDSGSGIFAVEKLFPWLVSHQTLKDAFLPITSASGEVAIDMSNLAGPLFFPGTWEYDITGSLKDVALKVLEAAPDISAVSGRFDLSKNRVTLSDVSAKISDTGLISAFADIPFIHQLALPVNLSRSTIDIQDDTTAFNGTLIFETGPELLLDLTDRAGSYRLNKAVINHQELSQGTLSHDETNPSFPFNLTGKIDTLTLEKLLRQESPVLQQLQDLTQGMRFLIEPHETSDFLISTPSIHLDDLTDKKRLTAHINSLESNHLLPDTITLKADTLFSNDLEFKPFEAVLHMTSGNKKMEINSTALCGINMAGLLKKQDDVIKLTVDLNKTGGDLAKTLSCMLDEAGLAEGSYSITGNLASEGSIAQIPKGFHGSIEINSPKGRIFRMTLLSRILSVINISSLFRGKLPDLGQDGFAYDSLEINAEVDRNLIHINNCVINGIDMTFIFTGSLNVEDKTMDLICLVAPFKTVDLIIEKIPILGTLLNNNLVSIPIKATGSIHDPDVVLLPGAEVGKGIKNTMERILNAPFKLLENL